MKTSKVKQVKGKEIESAQLEQFLQSRQPAEITEYPEVGSKDSGMSQGGFIGNRSDQRYMLKPGSMNPQNTTEIIDRNNVIYEYMAPFDRFLYDRAPVIGAATEGSKANPDKIYLRSKMVEGSELLDSYIALNYKPRTAQDQSVDNATVVIYIENNKLMWRRGENTPKEIKISDDISKGIPEKIYTALMIGEELKPNEINLLKQHGVHQFGYRRETQEIQGLEKILAICMFMGDHDFHPKNILVRDDNGQKILIKIDHGKAIHFYDTEQGLRKTLVQGMNRSLYQQMDVDVTKLKTSIDEICKISDQEIETLVKARSHQLRKMGFKLDDDLPYYVNGKASKLADGAYKIRLLKNVSDTQPLGVGQIALGIENGKLMCQVHGKEKIEITNQPELKEFIEKAERGEDVGPSAPHIPKIVEHLNNNHQGYILSDQELRYANLEQNYIKLYKKQRAALQDLSTNLELVQDMDKPDQWKQRNWLHEIQGNDIKEWAAANGVSFRANSNNSLSSEQLMLKIQFDLLKGDVESIKTLISEHNNPNIADQYGSTILHKAVEENSQDLVEFLLKTQADPNISDRAEGITPVFIAIHSDNSDIVELLHAHGADLNYMSTEGLTPLYVAMLQENHEMVQKLIELGADPKQKPNCLSQTEWQDLCKQYVPEQNSQRSTPTIVPSYTSSSDKHPSITTTSALSESSHSGFADIEEIRDSALTKMLSSYKQSYCSNSSTKIDSPTSFSSPKKRITTNTYRD